MATVAEIIRHSKQSRHDIPGDRRFVNAFYRSVERFTSSHDFALENLHVLNKEDSRIKNIKQRYCERLIFLIG